MAAPSKVQFGMSVRECRALLGMAEAEVVSIEDDWPYLQMYAEQETERNAARGEDKFDHRLAMIQAQGRWRTLRTVSRRLRKACG